MAGKDDGERGGDYRGPGESSLLRAAFLYLC